MKLFFLGHQKHDFSRDCSLIFFGRKFSRGGGKNSSPPSKGGGMLKHWISCSFFHAESVAGSVGLSLQTRGFAHGWIAPADKNGLQCIYESPQKIIVRLACWWWVQANCGPPNFHRQVLRDGNSSFCSISSYPERPDTGMSFFCWEVLALTVGGFSLIFSPQIVFFLGRYCSYNCPVVMNHMIWPRLFVSFGPSKIVHLFRSEVNVGWDSAAILAPTHTESYSSVGQDLLFNWFPTPRQQASMSPAICGHQTIVWSNWFQIRKSHNSRV